MNRIVWRAMDLRKFIPEGRLSPSRHIRLMVGISVPLIPTIKASVRALGLADCQIIA